MSLLQCGWPSCPTTPPPSTEQVAGALGLDLPAHTCTVVCAIRSSVPCALLAFTFGAPPAPCRLLERSFTSFTRELASLHSFSPRYARGPLPSRTCYIHTNKAKQNQELAISKRIYVCTHLD